jgi:uncharacterized protein YqgV (UPF0045/DUF77 family)
MIAEIQCLPAPMGTEASPYRHVEAAISAVADSRLRYEVGALGTTVEGPDDAVWAVVRAAHQATLTSGARSVVSIVKLFSSPGDSPGMDDLVAGHR